MFACIYAVQLTHEHSQHLYISAQWLHMPPDIEPRTDLYTRDTCYCQVPARRANALDSHIKACRVAMLLHGVR